MFKVMFLVKNTAQATTGPANGPLPTSSIPIIIFFILIFLDFYKILNKNLYIILNSNSTAFLG
jgi:hypothetical protein